MWMRKEYYLVVVETITNRLGINDSEDRGIPVEVKFFAPKMKEMEVKEMCLGDDHTIALTQRNHVYSFGYSTYGECGIGKFQQKVKPTRIRFKKNGGTQYEEIVRIACGFFSSYFVTASGIAFSTGNNSCGELCLGDKTKRMAPVQITLLGDEKVVDVRGGRLFAIFVTEEAIYFVGKNDEGQLCNGQKKHSLEPTRLTYFERNGLRVTKLFNSSNTVYFLVADGYGSGKGASSSSLSSHNNQLYVCGSNKCGEFGKGNFGNEEENHLPTRNMDQNLRHVVHVCGGSHSTHFLTRSGKVFSCGDGRKGSLGNGSFRNKVVIPGRVKLPSEGERSGRIVEVVTTKNATYYIEESSTSSSSIVKIYACGGNYFGQLMRNKDVPSVTMGDTFGLSGSNSQQIADPVLVQVVKLKKIREGVVHKEKMERITFLATRFPNKIFLCSFTV